MKTKYIIPIIILIMLFFSISVQAVENPITKTTLDYKEIDYLLFTSNTIVNLTYIDSELPSNSLTLDSKEYYPASNETKYKATSNTITPSSWMTPETKPFYYQDTNTGQIYIINIDYNSITPPPSNTQIEL